MAMAKMDKREKRGLIIFTACAVFIILTGIFFKVYDVYATGRVGSGRFNPQSFKVLDGYQVIFVGVVMLILELLMLLAFFKRENKDE